MMKRLTGGLVAALAVLLVAGPIAAQTYAPGSCYLTSSGITCQSGSTLTIASGATLAMNGTGTGGTYTLTNIAGGSANPWDYTGTLGIMDGSDTFQLFDVNITNANHTGGSNTVEVMNVANITGDANADETAFNIGTGWDYGILSGSPIAGTLGLTITGAAVNLNASSNFAVNIGTGTSTGTVTIGGTAAKTINIGADDTTAETIAIGSAKDTTAVNGQNLTLGSGAGTGNVVIQSGTGDVLVTSTDDIMLTTNTGAGENIAITNTQGTAAGAIAITATAGGMTLSSSSGIGITGPVVFGTAPTITAGIGTAATGVANSSRLGAIRQAVLTFTWTGANDMDVGDGGKTAGTLAYTFPEGRILVLGAVIDASVVTNNAYNANPNDIYYVGVGTVDGTQAADADLTSTEQDIIPKTTLDTVGSTTLTLDWHAAMATFAYANNVVDGTTTPVKLYVNIAVPDASNTGATTHAITGTLTVSYLNLGDY